MLTSEIVVAGPYYDELSVGQVFDESPGMTLTDGHAALHQAILGDRLRLALDADLAAHVIGDGTAPAHPGLVCDVAIGQSTLATQRVIANLFYRGLALRRSPRIGDTLRTVTEVVALRDTLRASRPRADRARGAACDDRRPARPPGARLSTAARCCRCGRAHPGPGTPPT